MSVCLPLHYQLCSLHFEAAKWMIKLHITPMWMEILVNRQVYNQLNNYNLREVKITSCLIWFRSLTKCLKIGFVGVRRYSRGQARSPTVNSQWQRIGNHLIKVKSFKKEHPLSRSIPSHYWFYEKVVFVVMETKKRSNGCLAIIIFL